MCGHSTEWVEKIEESKRFQLTPYINVEMWLQWNWLEIVRDPFFCVAWSWMRDVWPCGWPIVSRIRRFIQILIKNCQWHANRLKIHRLIDSMRAVNVTMCLFVLSRCAVCALLSIGNDGAFFRKLSTRLFWSIFCMAREVRLFTGCALLEV